MAKIIASGVPAKYPELGEIKIVVKGGMSVIHDIDCTPDKIVELFEDDMKEGPGYPLCAEPNTMRCALFVLFEWFGEEESCWTKEPEHVKLEGEIEPMESIPGTIY